MLAGSASGASGAYCAARGGFIRQRLSAANDEVGFGAWNRRPQCWPMEFTGYVDGVHGTMMIKTNGILKDGIWTGNWVIQHGAGELASVHGQGTFVGPPLSLDYEGRIHFSG